MRSGRLEPIGPGESPQEGGWANHTAMEGVDMVIRVRTPSQATGYLFALQALGIEEHELAMYRNHHGLE